MILQTKELKKIINVVKPGLSQKHLVPGMTRLILTGEFIVTYNGQECIHYPLQTDFSCSINASEFIKTIDRLKKPDVHLEIEGNQLVLKSGRIRTKFNIDADIKIVSDIIEQIMKEIEEGSAKDEWVEVPEVFTKAVANVAFAASTDKTKQTQCCIHSKYGYIIAADIHMGKVGFHFLDDESIFPEFMIIAKDALSIINAKVELMFITKAWIHFATEDGVIFSIRKIEGAFPYDAIFKQLEDTSPDLISIKMPPDISEAIETTGIFADDEDFPILITVSNNLMQFEAKSEMGEGEYESIIEYEGDKFSFRINSTLIKYILGVTNEMEIDKEHRKAVFNAGNFWYVMPVRVLE